MACDGDMTVHVCISSLIRFYSTQSQVGMSFLGIGIGEIIASVLSPYWEKYVFVPRFDFIMSYPDHLCFSEYTIARPSPTGARIPRKLVSSLAWRLLSSLLSVSSGSHSPLCLQCHGSYRSLDAFHTVWESFGLTLRFSHILSSECIQKPCFHRHDVSLTFFISSQRIPTCSCVCYGLQLLHAILIRSRIPPCLARQCIILPLE